MAKLKTADRNAALDAITTTAGATAYLWVYTGSAPGKTSNNFNAATGTLLSKHAMSNPIAPASVNGVLTCSTITASAAVASGTPGYWRINTDSTTTDGTTTVMEGSCGISSGELSFPGTVSSGTTVTPTLAITEGNA